MIDNNMNKKFTYRELAAITLAGLISDSILRYTGFRNGKPWFLDNWKDISIEVCGFFLLVFCIYFLLSRFFCWLYN
jgi:hypothetical protein